jgi:hypothetical protein
MPPLGCVIWLLERGELKKLKTVRKAKNYRGSESFSSPMPIIIIIG